MALTKATNQIAKLRVVPRFGDVAMINQLIHSKIWRQLYSGDIKAWFSVFVWLVNIKIEMFASSARHIFRFNHGRHSTGILTSLWTISMMVAFNSASEFGFMVTFVPFFLPVLPFLIPVEKIEQMALIDVRSEALLVVILVYTLCSIIHVLFIYLEKGETRDHAKRGTSILHVILKKILPVNEYFVQIIIEPMILILAGYIAIDLFFDPVLGVFLFLAAGSLFFQEIVDGVFRYVHRKA